jgi:hypothetical protein
MLANKPIAGALMGLEVYRPDPTALSLYPERLPTAFKVVGFTVTDTAVE